MGHKRSFEINGLLTHVLGLLLLTWLSPGSATGQACPDGFEPNDTLGAPGWDITSGPLVSYICAASDLDYFRISGVGIGHTIEVDLSDLPKDYDLTLYRPDLSQAAYSDNAGTNAEKILFTADASGVWHVRISGKGQFDATRPYTIFADLFACALDRFEPNANADGATSFGHPTTTRSESGLNLCPPGEQDWFSLDLGKAERLIADLTHDPSQGPLSMCLVNPDKTTLRNCTNGILATERIDILVPQAGRYYLRIASTSQGGSNPSYTVAATVHAAPPTPIPCRADAGERNDSATRSTLTGLCPDFGCPNTVYSASNLSICRGDEDWFYLVLDRWETLDARIFFTHADGDLDMELYELGSNTPLVTADSGTDDEYLFFRASRDNTGLTLRVFAKYENGRNLSYGIELKRSPLPPTPTRTATPLPTATPTQIVCPANETKLDLTLEEMEVTQSIQDLNHSVPLVGGKRTYARLYVKADRDVFLPRQATAYLRAVAYDGTPLVPATASCHGYLRYIKRRFTGILYERSRTPRIGLSCRLPTTWTAPNAAPILITGHVDTPSGYCDPRGDNDETSVYADFEAPIRVFLQAVQVRDGCTDPSCGPSYVGYKDLHLLAERMWPTSSVILIPDRGDSLQWQDNDPTLAALLAKWNDYTDAKKAKLPGQTAANTVLVGMRNPFVGFGSRGFASGTAFWNTTDRPVTFAHEFGHAGGNLVHVGGCMRGTGNGTGGLEPYPYDTTELSPGHPRGFWGLDTGFTPNFPHVIDPRAYSDVMTYCANRWTSDYSFKKFARHQSPTYPRAAFATASPAFASLAPSFARLVGYVDTQTDEVVLQPLRFTDDAVVNEGDDFFDGYSAASIDADGNILDERDFLPNVIHDSLTTRASFAVHLLVHPDMAGVVILRNGVEIFARLASQSTPTVEVDPVEGTVGELLTLRWATADEDGDPVFVNVELSSDGGESWSPLSLNLDGTSAVYDTSLWAGTTQGYLRVRASDGFHESWTDVGPFAVEPKDPVAYILTPGNGAELQLGEPLSLRASAFDPEEGFFDDAAFSWFSDVDGGLGSGEELYLEDLTPGWHEISVEVTDSDGRTGFDTIALCASNLLCDGDPAECPLAGSAPDADEDGVCDAIDICPTDADPGQGDADEDGLGDACDPCTDGAVPTRDELRLKDFPGNRDGLDYDATLEFETPPQIDPTTTGLSLSISDGNGEPLTSLLLPPGEYDSGVGGWSTSRHGYHFRSATGSRPEVRAIVRIQDENVVTVSLRASGGDFASSGIPLQLAATLNLTPGVGATGLCAESTFGGGCYLNEDGEWICP